MPTSPMPQPPTAPTRTMLRTGWMRAWRLATLPAAALILATSLASAQQPAAKVPVPTPIPVQPAPPAAAPPAAVPPGGAGVGSAWKADVTKDGALQTGQTLDPKQLEAIKKVDVYFGELVTLQGRFVQTTTADKKQSRGKFFVKKPGLFRFNYAPPSRLVIISNGSMLMMENHETNQVDSLPIDSTPFRLLLRKDVNIVRDAKIIDIQESEDLIVLALVEKGGDSSGAIKLLFLKQPILELKEWVITDVQGVQTTIEVSDLDRKTPIDDRQFQGSDLIPKATTGGN